VLALEQLKKYKWLSGQLKDKDGKEPICRATVNNIIAGIDTNKLTGTYIQIKELCVYKQTIPER